jgi:predicted nucleic acid-binding protein
VIILDASVLIAHLDDRDAHHDKARKLLSTHSVDPLGASEITLAETLVAPTRAGRLADADAALRKLGIARLQLGENAPQRLATLRAETNLKMPDCCVLLAAQEYIGAVASFDSELCKAAEKLGLEALAGSIASLERKIGK